MIGVPVFASFTATASPLPALKVTVTVAGVLEVCCALTAWYWKVTVAVDTPVGAVAGVATNEPSGLTTTVPPCAAPDITAVIGRPEGSLA